MATYWSKRYTTLSLQSPQAVFTLRTTMTSSQAATHKSISRLLRRTSLAYKHHGHYSSPNYWNAVSSTHGGLNWQLLEFKYVLFWRRKVTTKAAKCSSDPILWVARSNGHVHHIPTKVKFRFNPKDSLAVERHGDSFILPRHRAYTLKVIGSRIKLLGRWRKPPSWTVLW